MHVSPSPAVPAGHRAVVFHALQGVKPGVLGEGLHFLVPYFEVPTLFDVKPTPRTFKFRTATAGEGRVGVSACLACRTRALADSVGDGAASVDVPSA